MPRRAVVDLDYANEPFPEVVLSPAMSFVRPSVSMFADFQSNTIINGGTIINNITTTCICGKGDSLENGSTNRTDIAMENIANKSVHLHLQHTEICKCIFIPLRLHDPH